MDWNSRGWETATGPSCERRWPTWKRSIPGIFRFRIKLGKQHDPDDRDQRVEHACLRAHGSTRQPLVPMDGRIKKVSHHVRAAIRYGIEEAIAPIERRVPADWEP